jgi:deazaflavin-dependent oxidoreductase (nitroreductase family)
MANPAHDEPPRLPLRVRIFSPLLKALLQAGVPILWNRLVTIRGRTSGQPRTTPLAVIPAAGTFWVWAPWPGVQWARNLRAAGRATVTIRGRRQEMTATELDAEQRVWFFRDVLGPFARRLPFGLTFIRLVDDVDISHPEQVARDRRVFELRPLA